MANVSSRKFYISLIAYLCCWSYNHHIILSFTYALLQNKCDEKYIGRVISYNDMFFMLSVWLQLYYIGLMAKFNFSWYNYCTFGNSFFSICFLLHKDFRNGYKRKSFYYLQYWKKRQMKSLNDVVLKLEIQDYFLWKKEKNC